MLSFMKKDESKTRTKSQMCNLEPQRIISSPFNLIEELSIFAGWISEQPGNSDFFWFSIFLLFNWNVFKYYF